MEPLKNPFVKMCDRTFVLLAVPTWYGAGKMGTETAPEAFKKFQLDEKLRAKGIKNLGWFDVVPEGIKPGGETTNYEKGVFYTQRNLYLQALGFLRLGKCPLVFGGDHTTAIGSIAAQTAYLGGARKLGLIWIDAHLDAHTLETSDSKHIHGMPLAILSGHGSEKLTSIGGEFLQKVYPQNIIHIGANSWEPAEMEFFLKHKIRFFPQKEVKTDEGFSRMCAAVTELSKNVEAIALSIDADAFDISVAPGVHLPSNPGISEKTAYALARHLKTCPNIGGIDVSEIVPAKDPEGKTIQFMYNFIVELLAP